MIQIRRSAERGQANHGWLQSRHSFSFAGYRDARFMGVGNLRVLNDDIVAPGHGFGAHPHRDMEIVSYAIEGAITHADDMGNQASVAPGDVQVMSAGTGVTHSEWNRSGDAPAHFLQIWILPSAAGGKPGYEQKRFDFEATRGAWVPLATPDAREGSLRIRADASISSIRLGSGQSAAKALDPARLAYVHVVRGSVMANGERLSAGDAATLSGEALLSLEALADSEALLFDLAPS